MTSCKFEYNKYCECWDLEICITNGMMTMRIDVSEPSGVTSEDWTKLIDGDHKIAFGDCYGSHVDNGVVSIQTEGDLVTFYVDGARGGTLMMSKNKDATMCGDFQVIHNTFVEYENQKSTFTNTVPQ